VSTPIGNLGDITYRAIHILKNVDLIAAEDTRKTRILLQQYEISNKLSSYHSYNLKRETPRLVQLLLDGSAVALVTDAGTPGISDPGYQLVQACIKEQIRVIPIPGPSAFLAAIAVSGLSSHRFVYEGFLPVKKGRKTRLEQLAKEQRTIILYESPHRIRKTVDELIAYWGDRKCVLAREITKKFEEFFRGNLTELKEHLTLTKIRGEMVLVIEGNSGKNYDRS